MSVDIGKRLKQVREMQGLTLEDIAAQTRIPRKYLLAIENGQFDLLPSPIYVRSYVRSYANRVGENPQLLLRHYNPSAKTSAPRGKTGAYPTVSQDVGRERSAISSTRNRTTMDESTSRQDLPNHYSRSETVPNRYHDAYESSQSRGEFQTRLRSQQDQLEQRDLSQTMSMRARRYNSSSNGEVVQSNSSMDSTYPSTNSNIHDESSTILEAEVVSSTSYPSKRRPTMPADVPDPEELGIDSKTKRREIQAAAPLPSRSASTLSRTQRMQALSEDDDEKTGFSFGKLYNWLLIVGAIGLAIALIVFLWTMNSEEGSTADAESKPGVEAKQSGSDGGAIKRDPILTLIATSPNGVDRWELSNAQKIDLKVDVAAGKESKLEIRDQEVGEPIVSTNVKSGEMFTKSLNKTIWITLSSPMDTTVTLNGKKLPTNGYKKEKSFHINLVN